MVDKLLGLAIIGIEPVLWVLIIMSVISFGVIMERFLAFNDIQNSFKTIDEYNLRLKLDARLGILATFGNNAPFIGLFGTVLGVIDAFHRLGVNNNLEVSAVMGGISEALVATATGLFVAIPCVIAYNYFVRRMKKILILKEAYEALR